MGFLDNLENNLKAMEGREEAVSGRDHGQHRREAERREALAAAPYAERLKSGPFTEKLLEQATVAGHRVRTKVHFVWIGSTLRLETRNRRLELRPTAGGVIAVFLEEGRELRNAAADLDGDPAPLIDELLALPKE
jgi:hypothetical protein